MKCFIISLSKIEPSIRTALNLKKQLEDFGMNAELFEGTYGNDAVKLMEQEGRTLYPIGLKGEIDLESKYGQKLQTPGVKGCFYSHYNLWKKCVELNEPIIIFEDDIVIRRPFIEIDWEDILIVALGHPSKSERWLHLLDEPTGTPEALQYKTPSMPGCCGYAIKPKAAKKLLEKFHNTYLPADNAIHRDLLTIQIHSYIMGKALLKADGKKSLTRTSFWNDFNKD